MLENTQVCPICNTTSDIEDLSDRDSYNVNCPRCGKYIITDGALTMFQRSELVTKILSVSFWIRQHQSPKSKPSITIGNMRKILIPFTSPKPKEQADKLLIWIGSTVKKYDAETAEPLSSLLSVTGAVDEKGIQYVANYLKDKGHIKHSGFSYSVQDGRRNPPVDLLRAQMTFNGWDRFYELDTSNKDSRLAFMAMQYDNSTMDRIFNDIIRDAVEQTGFDIRTLDEERRAGLIDDKLRVEIRRSKFLIADLTDDNNGAYWEAGYAEGLGMPVIYICEEEKFEGKKTHFDTNHHLTVQWKDDPESLKLFAEELKATIRDTLPNDAKMED